MQEQKTGTTKDSFNGLKHKIYWKEKYVWFIKKIYKIFNKN